MDLNPLKIITSPITRGRAEEHQRDAESQAIADRYKALGMNELGQYRTGQLQPGQEKLIADTEQENIAASESFARQSGVSESFKQSMNDHFKMDSSIMRETFQESHLQKAIQALGYSWQETQQILQNHAAERQQKDQIYTGMMGAIGGAITLFALA